ncbi:tetratricopeptide repeat protein [Saccharopolyspora sp. NPDC003762]
MAQLIRFALHTLSARNGHHQFEDLCRHYAREEISRNILPATGPVSAGGDQGRDFETFCSFTAVEGGRTLTFACTLEQERRLPEKIKSDVKKIMSGGSVDMVYVFCGENLVTSRRHQLAAWAQAEYQVALEIFDGNALAELLANPDVYWIAERYLALPSQAALNVLAVTPPPSGLPRKARPLVGRDSDLAQGMEWLCSQGSLRQVIVVTGPPGVGKTEFAIALAESAAPQFPDGQYLVEVPTVGDGADEPDLLELLSGVVDGGVVRPPETRQQLVSRLRCRLAGRRTLLVIDNVVSEDALRELLAIDSGINLVCTSRSRLTGLGVDDVRLVEIEPLPRDDAAALARKTATRLTEEESHALASVCGGLPLAVLIAAAQIRSRPKLSVQDFLQRLADPDRGMEELSAGQRSMAAVIEYSYQSLSQTHAGLVQALGLLPNTTVALHVIAAATAGKECKLTDDHVRRTTRLLDDLFELNLLQQPETDGFRLHDVLYRFARAKTSETEQEWREQVIANGCLMYAARAQHAVSSIGYADQNARVPAESNQVALAMLEHDRAGAVAMAEAACHAKLWNQAVALAGVIIPALLHLSHWDDLTRACRCIQEAGEHTGNQQWVASALHNLGIAEAHRGNTDEAIDLYRRSADVAKDAGDPVTHHIAHVSYGKLLLDLGHTTEGIAILRSTLRIWRLLEDDTTLAQVLGKIGKAHTISGDLRQAETYLRNAIGVASRADLAQLLPSLRSDLATVLRLSGQENRAREESQAALERARGVGSRAMEANALLELGMFGSGVGDEDSPEDALAEALRIYREIGDVHGQVKALRFIGVNAKERGKLDQAIASLEECTDLARQVGDAAEAAYAMAHMARIHGDIGRHEEADELFQHAEQIAESTGNELLVAQVRDQQAILLRAVGQTSKAIPLLQKSVRTLARRGPSENLAATQTLLGEALVHDHQWDEAAQVLRPVAEAPSGTVSTAVRAAAFQHLAVLYSHRELWQEAEDAGRRGLTLAQEAGSMDTKMRGHVTLGNILARMGRWQEASDEYELASTIAGERRAVHTLLIIHSNQASCYFHLGDADKAITQTRRSIEIAAELGLAEMEASLRLNLGANLIGHGKLEEAVAEFTTARDAASASNNANVVGSAEKNLAQAYRSSGDLTSAITSARNARMAFQSCNDWAAAAKSLRLELAVTCQEANSVDPYKALSALQTTSPGIPSAVIARSGH